MIVLINDVGSAPKNNRVGVMFYVMLHLFNQELYVVVKAMEMWDVALMISPASCAHRVVYGPKE